MFNPPFKIFCLLICFILINSNSANSWYNSSKNFLNQGWYHNPNENRYSLAWEDETCNSLSAGKNTGYTRSDNMNPMNADGGFNPSISLRHGYKMWGLHATTYGTSDRYCNSLHSSATTFSIPNGDVTCHIFNTRDFCMVITSAPDNPWELYRWLARIHIAHYGTDKKYTHPNLLDAVSADSKKYLPVALSNSQDSYKHINLKGLGLNDAINDPNKRAKFMGEKGQKMICIMDIGLGVTGGRGDNCKDASECLKNLNRLVKCILIPLGPPPPPYAKFIVNELQINAVYNKASTYDSPKARVVYLERSAANPPIMTTKSIDFNTLKEGSNTLNFMDTNSAPGLIDFSKQDHVDFANNNLEVKNFEIMVSQTSICTNLLSNVKLSTTTTGTGLNAITTLNADKRLLGCFDRGTPIAPKLAAIGIGSNTTLKVDYNNQSKVLTPISIVELQGFLVSWDGIATNSRVVKFDDSIFSSFRTGGFHYNPENKQEKFKGKKICSILSSANIYENVIIDIMEECESNLTIAKKLDKVFLCDNDELVAGDKDCADQSKTPILTQSIVICKNGNQVLNEDACIQCRKPDQSPCTYNEALDDKNNCKNNVYTDKPCTDHNGVTNTKSFLKCADGEITANGVCNGVNMKIEYDDELNDAKKICLRGYESAESEYFVIVNGKEVKFKQNEKVLMQLDVNKSIVFDINSLNFKKFNSWPQKDLDRLFYLSEDSFIYQPVDLKIKPTYYRYSNQVSRIVDPNDKTQFSETQYSNIDGKPFFLGPDQKFFLSPPELCVDIKPDYKTSRAWNYILQMPIYYANYDIETAQDSDLSGKTFEKLTGGFSMANTSYFNTIITNNNKKNVLLVPTEYYTSASAGKPRQEGNIIIAIADPKLIIKNTRTTETRILGYEKNSLGQYINKWNPSKYIKNLNNSPTLFESLRYNKILYPANVNLAGGLMVGNNITDYNLFNTSGCDLIEFEIWGGGSSSSANIVGEGPSCNENSKSYTGQNGAYAAGRFRIVRGAPIRMKVANAGGKISKYANSSLLPVYDDNYINKDSDNYSAIWIKEKDTKGAEQLVEMVRANSGSTKHYCNGWVNCSLNRSSILEKNFRNQMFQLDDDRYIDDQNLFDKPHPYALSDSLKYADIAIDKFREVNFSGSCGTTTDLLSTLPLSFPIMNQTYDKNGKVEKSFLPNFTKDGTGNLNEIGTYFYSFFNKNPIQIDWSKRSNYAEEQDKICKKKLEICHKYGINSSAITGSFNDANISNWNLDISTPPNPLPDAISDLNLHCPGLGGCYYKDSKKIITHSGNAGLIKITCKPM